MILASICITLRVLAQMLTAAGRVPFTIISTAVAFGVFGPDTADLSLQLIDWMQQWATADAIESAAAAPFPPEPDQREP
jgi:hypothetical protein